ncbi:hypothetical protein ZIOFF_070953 [Zingiber officinale]|uniref:Uncharacterized protein n=1 Tax=Zingiber officinale TaxID=94328 RepID=A0A8J5EQ78_ZINOF|nr:hypothetical protein ZIOFF_070953 [Zingiber officinale]
MTYSSKKTGPSCYARQTDWLDSSLLSWLVLEEWQGGQSNQPLWVSHDKSVGQVGLGRVGTDGLASQVGLDESAGRLAVRMTCSSRKTGLLCYARQTSWLDSTLLGWLVLEERSGGGLASQVDIGGSANRVSLDGLVGQVGLGGLVSRVGFGGYPGVPLNVVITRLKSRAMSFARPKSATLGLNEASSRLLSGL